ncbi:MAG: TonB-dependent receptor [Calditrichaeota bacterium]|nr:MAG: TonB-dependent receptor [Calditrichota bacterium]
MKHYISGLVMRTNRILIIACFLLGILLPTKILTQGIPGDITEITLEALLNTKISTAAKYAQTQREAPASISIITSEDIERYGFETLDQVLNSLRGFYISYDRNYSYVGVRGFGRPTDYNDRILVLINGHPTNDNFYNSASVGTDLGINIEEIERIEIVRGPGSALYGTSAMFAVINVITKSGNLVEGLKATFRTGSYGKSIGELLFGREFNNGLNLTVSATIGNIDGQDLYFPEYDDPSTNNGIAQHLDWDKFYSLSSLIQFKNLNIYGRYSSREKAFPTGAWEVAFNHPNSKTIDNMGFIELKYQTHHTGPRNLLLKVYADHYDYKGFYPYEDEDEDGNPYVYDSWDSNQSNWFGSEAQFIWDTHSNNRLVFGAEYRKHLDAEYRYWEPDTVYFDSNIPYNTQSLYVQDEIQIHSNFTFTAGLRYDRYSFSENSLTPRTAIVFNPSRQSTLKLLYGEAFRAPNLYEVYYDDPVSGYKPNYLLKPEKIRTIELAWEQQFGKSIMGLASLYYNRITDLIDQTIDPADSLIQFQNVSKVSSVGIEFELQARFNSGVSGYLNTTIQNSENQLTRTELTNSPGFLFKAGFVLPVRHLLYTALEFRYETRRLTVYDTYTEPFFLTNLTLTTPTIANHFKVALKVRNLWDVDYQYPGGYEHLQPAITQDGRNFTFSFKVTL